MMIDLDRKQDTLTSTIFTLDILGNLSILLARIITEFGSAAAIKSAFIDGR